MNILFVHGMFSCGGEFPKLRAALEKKGHRCFTPQLAPDDASKGIVDLSHKLDAYVQSHIPSDETFAIIGFSMGCLIARYYVQFIAGESRITAFFSISGPHHGSYIAYLYTGKGARDLRPGSRFLQKLNAYGHRLKTTPTYSYRLKFDPIIIPSDSCDWGGGNSRIVNGFLHPVIPFNLHLIADISRRLRLLDNHRINHTQPDCAQQVVKAADYMALGY